MLTSNPGNTNDCSTIPQVGSSDHFGIHATISLLGRNAFMNIMQSCIPRSRLPRRKSLPWLSKKIKSKLSSLYTQKCNKLRKEVALKVHAAKLNYFKPLKPSVKSFWKTVNSLNRGKL